MKEKLLKLRNEIDRIDTEILGLIEARQEVVKQVGELKKNNTSRIYVPERELEIFKRLASISKTLDYEKIKIIFTEIISACRDLERRFNVVIFDIEGERIAKKIFGSYVNIIMIEKKSNLNYNGSNYDFILAKEKEVEIKSDEYIVAKVLVKDSEENYCLIGKLDAGMTREDYTLCEIEINRGL